MNSAENIFYIFSGVHDILLKEEMPSQKIMWISTLQNNDQ